MRLLTSCPSNSTNKGHKVFFFSAKIFHFGPQEPKDWVVKKFSHFFCCCCCCCWLLSFDNFLFANFYAVMDLFYLSLPFSSFLLRHFSGFGHNFVSASLAFCNLQQLLCGVTKWIHIGWVLSRVGPGLPHTMSKQWWIFRSPLQNRIPLAGKKKRRSSRVFFKRLRIPSKDLI